MINVLITKNFVEIKGHAGFAEKGSDIVCASVSTAAEMTVNQIEVFGLKDNIETSISDGYLAITVKKEDKVITKVLDNLFFTLKDLEKEFPKFIKIKEK